MKLLQYLKALLDIAFLYGSFGTFFVLFLGANDALCPIFLLALILSLGHALQGKSYRFVALALALSVIPFVHSIADALMPLIVLCYLFVSIKKEEYHYTSYHEIDRARWQVIALPVLMLILALFGQGSLVSQYMLPRTILYFISLNLFLRFLRADKATLSSPSFLAFHAFSLAGVLLAGALLSSEQLIHAVLCVLQFVYSNLVVPLFTGMAMAIFGVLYLGLKLLVWVFSGFTPEETESATANYGVAEYVEESASVLSDVPTWLETVFYCVVAVIVVGLVWLVLRNMLSGFREKKGEVVVTVVRQKNDAPKQERAPLFFFAPRQKLRHYYAQFIRYAKQKGIVVKASTDTAQLEQKFGKSEATACLTQHYRHARYDEMREVEKYQAEEAKAALKAIKASGKVQ